MQHELLARIVDHRDGALVALLRARLAVDDVAFGHPERSGGHELALDFILNGFDIELIGPVFLVECLDHGSGDRLGALVNGGREGVRIGGADLGTECHLDGGHDAQGIGGGGVTFALETARQAGREILRHVRAIARWGWNERWTLAHLPRSRIQRPATIRGRCLCEIENLEVRRTHPVRLAGTPKPSANPSHPRVRPGFVGTTEGKRDSGNPKGCRRLAPPTSPRRSGFTSRPRGASHRPVFGLRGEPIVGSGFLVAVACQSR